MSATFESRSDIFYLSGMNAHIRDMLTAYGMEVYRTPENIAVDTFIVVDSYGRKIARYSINHERIMVPNLGYAVGMVPTLFTTMEYRKGGSYGLLTVERFVAFVEGLGYIADMLDFKPSTALCASVWALVVDPASKQPKRYLTWKECFQLVELFPDWQPAEVEQVLIHELHPRAIEGLREGLHPMVLRELYGRLP